MVPVLIQAPPQRAFFSVISHAMTGLCRRDRRALACDRYQHQHIVVS